MAELSGVLAVFIPIVGAVALFSFLAVASWSEQRRREREAYYRSEVLKKMADAPGANTQLILELLREEERGVRRRRREGLKLGGLITAAVGLGIAVFLKMIVTADQPVWTVGFVPLFIGLALLLYALVLAPKPGDTGSEGSSSRPPQA